MSWPSTWADDIEAGRVDLTDAEVRAALVADLRGWRAVPDAVLSRLAGRPEIAEYVALVAAEVERLRQIEAAAEAYHAEWDRWKRIAVDLADEEHRLLRSLAVAAVDCRLADEIAEWVDGLELHGDAELMAALAALGESTPEVPSDG